MMDLDLDRLEALARAATPGGWWSDFNGYVRTKTADQPAFAVALANPSQGKQATNAQFIAATDPQTVVALITKLRAAEQLIEEFPRALLTAGADQVIEDRWQEKIGAYQALKSAASPADTESPDPTN